MEHITYSPKGVCARRIDIDIEDGIIIKASFYGGCSGNTQGLSALLVGMSAEEAIERLEGIRCGFKPTSCPDQLSKALKEYINK
ncbi:MAG: TIGR03905 family TSCPD domain-containing protein [Ruminococcaceae bacterium]|nr:TIGR03905 family TSCPD domain-containing protein [Oscillospiraceae bacterium]